jgi:hypothetical protein
MTETIFHWPGRRTDDPAHEMLAAFLVMDIQRNPEWAREVADRIAEVQSGKIPKWERIGNAFRLEISKKGVSIEDLVDEDSPGQKIPLEDFGEAVNAWIEACG